MKTKKMTKQIVEKFRKIHNFKYDYSKMNYVSCKKKVEIICPKHGTFFQTPYHHLNRQQGCPKCSGKNKTTPDFIEKSNEIHNNIYDYSLVNYRGCFKKVKIVCSIHGIFKQSPYKHLWGNGCKKCEHDKLSKERRSNNFDFIEKSKIIHNNIYEYKNVKYDTNAHKKVEIICPKHGPFLQTPHNHLRGTGCPKCSLLISKPEQEFLDYLKIKIRQKKIGKFKVDGINKKTIYEFLGDYYHGNPKKYNSNEYNQICHKTFGELYNDTFKKFKTLKSLGYNIKYIWELDWKNFTKKIDKTPKLITY